MITWNTVIYVLSSLALAVLVVALASRQKTKSSDWSTTTLAFGLIWTTLVLGAGADVRQIAVRVLADRICGGARSCLLALFPAQ